MDEVSSRLVVAIVFLLWVVIGLSGYFNVANTGNNSSTEYSVSDSHFKIYDWWSFISSNSTNDSLIFDNQFPTNFESKTITLCVTQYANKSMFDSELQSSDSSLDKIVVKDENLTIEGINVRFINFTNTNGTKTFQNYYFQKNSKYYSINVKYWTYPINEIYDNAVKITEELIISTIN
jgi:hypothetical protein